ncbi:hypothetical protein [Bdellovibrio sp. HCB274]|uniref:hypothetical protein n=1 Tax=Bdellovibrio sp. HCB274 TaxID=3394361 RepID=UPI0039B69F90
MKKFILFFTLLIVASSSLISCGSPPAKVTESASTSDENGVTDDTALYLNVSTRWETQDDTATPQLHKTCKINSLAGDGYTEQCTATIPEGQLYYSDVIFTVGTKLATMCPIVSMHFYYYIRSNSATYMPPGDTTTVDCSTEAKRDAEKKCWGGAAPQILDTDFPKNTGLYHLTGASLFNSYTLESANSVRWDNDGMASNLMSTNNMEDTDRDTPATKYFVDTTDSVSIAKTRMRDYWVACRDLWNHPRYYIRLKLIEEDTKSQDGTLDEVEDWK